VLGGAAPSQPEVGEPVVTFDPRLDELDALFRAVEEANRPRGLGLLLPPMDQGRPGTAAPAGLSFVRYSSSPPDPASVREEYSEHYRTPDGRPGLRAVLVLDNGLIYRGGTGFGGYAVFRVAPGGQQFPASQPGAPSPALQP
jgi:hypothetical protein